jgi:hypothetical protein
LSGGFLTARLLIPVTAAGLAVALMGCMSRPDLTASTEPTVTVSPERAAAIAEMRAMAEAGDSMPYPDAFQTEQTARLITREEPHDVIDARAIETELALIAEQRAKARDPSEIAALDERARQLRKLALSASAGGLRQ